MVPFSSILNAMRCDILKMYRLTIFCAAMNRAQGGWERAAKTAIGESEGNKIYRNFCCNCSVCDPWQFSVHGEIVWCAVDAMQFDYFHPLNTKSFTHTHTHIYQKDENICIFLYFSCASRKYCMPPFNGFNPSTNIARCGTLIGCLTWFYHRRHTYLGSIDVISLRLQRMFVDNRTNCVTKWKKKHCNCTSWDTWSREAKCMRVWISEWREDREKDEKRWERREAETLLRSIFTS